MFRRSREVAADAGRSVREKAADGHEQFAARAREAHEQFVRQAADAHYGIESSRSSLGSGRSAYEAEPMPEGGTLFQMARRAIRDSRS